MPDKNLTNWTSDEAFWNDGWANMNQRLRRKERRPLLLLLLLFGCLFAAGTLVLYASQAAPPTAEVRAVPSAQQDIPPLEQVAPVPSETTPVLSTRESPSVPTAPDPVLPGRVAAVPRGRGTLVGPANLAPAIPAPFAPGHRKQSREQRYATVATPLKSELYYLPVASLLPNLRVALPPVDTALALASIVPASNTSGWSLSLGSNAYTETLLPGASAEIGYRRRLRKYYVPVTLRYDHSRRNLTLSDATTPGSTLAPGTSGSGVPVNLATADLRSAVEANTLNRLTTHCLELRTGLGRQLTDRLSLAGGLGGTYLVAGRGPGIAFSTDPNTNSYGYSVQQDQLFTSVAQANVAAGGGTRLIDTSVHRWGLSGWLGLEYRVVGNWSAGLGLTRQLKEIYREEILNSGHTRFEVKLTKAW